MGSPVSSGVLPGLRLENPRKIGKAFKTCFPCDGQEGKSGGENKKFIHLRVVRPSEIPFITI